MLFHRKMDVVEEDRSSSKIEMSTDASTAYTTVRGSSINNPITSAVIELDSSSSDSQPEANNETSPSGANGASTQLDASGDTQPVQTRLEKLKAFQSTLQDQWRMVNTRIYDLETLYLEETVHGNVVKGWEMDGRTAPLYRSRSIIEDKERLFSYSSHRYQQDRRLHPEIFATNDRASRVSTSGSTANTQTQKRKSGGSVLSAANLANNNTSTSRKRKATDAADEHPAYNAWNGLEDY